VRDNGVVLYNALTGEFGARAVPITGYGIGLAVCMIYVLFTLLCHTPLFLHCSICAQALVSLNTRDVVLADSAGSLLGRSADVEPGKAEPSNAFAV
jgi:hypothetical protein